MDFREWINRPEHLWRADAGRDTKYPFYATDLRFISEYSGKGLVITNPMFNRVMEAKDKAHAAQILEKEAPPKAPLSPGRIGKNEAEMLRFDLMLGDSAKTIGYDAIHYQDAHEVQILNMGQNKPQEWEYNDQDLPTLLTGEII